jgi:hypothetical protein
MTGNYQEAMNAIQNGADLNVKDGKGRTALYLGNLTSI